MSEQFNPAEALAQYRKTVEQAYAPHVSLPGEDGHVAREAAATAISYMSESLSGHDRGTAFYARRYEWLTGKLGCDPLS